MNSPQSQVLNDPDGALSEIPAKSDIVVVAQGGGTAFISTAATRILSYVYSLALIKVLGAEDFGQFSLALASVLFFGTLASIGLPQGIVRFGVIHNPSNPKAGVHQTTLTAIRMALPVSVLFTLVVFLSAHLIAQDLFHKPDLYGMIRIFAISIPFMSMQAIFLASTRALKVIRYSAIVWIIQPLLALLLGLFLVMRGYGANAAALAYVISFVCGAFLALLFYLRVIPPTDRSGRAFPAGQMLNFSIPLSLTEWMHFANERTEIYFLGLLSSAVNISIYKIAWSLAGLETMLRLSLEQILAPFSSDLSHRKETKQLERLYKAVTKWGFTIAVMLFVIYVLFGKELMYIFDPALAAGTWVLIALALAQLINEFTGPCNTLLIMSGRSDLTLMNTIILLVSSVALDWLLIPRYGLLGAAIAGAICVIFINILRVVEVWWTLKIHPWKWSLWKPALSGILAGGIVWTLRQAGLSGSLVVELLMIFVFCGAYFFINVLLKLDPDDLTVLSYFRRKLTVAK